MKFSKKIAWEKAKNQEASELFGCDGRDMITGFEGKITGQVIYITGCKQLNLVPKVKDGKVGDNMWFDIDRIEYNPKSRVELEIKDTGCDSVPFGRQSL